MRLSVVATCLSLCLIGFSSAQDAHASIRKETNIPAQGLGPALSALAKDRNFQIVYITEEIADVRTEGAVGEFTNEEALKRLLSGTGLTFRYLDDKTVTIGSATPQQSRTPRASKTASSGSDAANSPQEGQKNNSYTFRLARAGTGPSSSDVSVKKPASPANQEVGLAEIVVTAQLRNQNLQDVPMAVAAISGDLIRSKHITNISDLSYLVPGLDVAPIGLGQQAIAVRGVSAERGSSSLTGEYLDNVPLSGLQDNFIQTYPDVGMQDLARVEVLKGPQGTLFGEGAVGGVVRFVTNDPDLSQNAGNLEATSFYTKGGALSEGLIGVANIPVVANEFGVRIAANLVNDSGWIDQPDIGRNNINDNKLADVRLKALWTPTSSLTVTGLAIAREGTAGASDFVNYGPPKISQFEQISINPGFPTNMRDRYQIYNLGVNYDLGFATLLSSTSHITQHTLQNLTSILGGTPYDHNTEVYEPDYTQDRHTTAQELRLTSSDKGPLTWVVGAIYKDELLDAGGPLVDETLFNGALVISDPISPSTLASRNYAVYGDSSYKLTSRFEVGGGLRYFYQSIDTFSDAARSSSYQKSSDDATTWRAYASYAVSNNVKTYVNVGTGFRSGSFNPASVVAQGAPLIVNPEHDISYEGGVKSTFLDRRLILDAAIFYSSYTGLQDDVVDFRNNAIFQYTANNQNAHIKGAEWNVDWKVAPTVSLTFAGTFLDTRIDTILPGSSYNVGDPISFVPKYSLTAGGNYEFKWSDRWDGSVNADFNRKGKSCETLNGVVGLDDPRQVCATPVNFLNVGISGTHDGWSMTAFLRNALDERGLIRVSATGDTAQGRPLNVGITVRKEF